MSTIDLTQTLRGNQTLVTYSLGFIFVIFDIISIIDNHLLLSGLMAEIRLLEQSVVK